jgi:hypothetical protein
MTHPAIKQAQGKIKVHAHLAVKATDWRKPLGALKAPPPTGAAVIGAVTKMAFGVGMDFQNMQRGNALKNAAKRDSLASNLQQTIESLAGVIASLPEPQKSINLEYLDMIADATVAAGRACQKLRSGRDPSKKETRWAASCVVTLACGLVEKIDPRVKNAAVQAYPLMSAGKKLNTIADPIRAINVSYIALGVS